MIEYISRPEKPPDMRKCWNRQTGTFEVRVSMTCGFKSHLPHQEKSTLWGAFLFFYVILIEKSICAPWRCTMSNNLFFKLMLLSAVLGLGLLFSVVLSGVAYPNLFFQVATPLGLLFVFASPILAFVSWLWDIRDTAKSGQYAWALVVAVLGIVFIIQTAIKFLF